jgi:hypothetical protein
MLTFSGNFMVLSESFSTDVDSIINNKQLTDIYSMDVLWQGVSWKFCCNYIPTFSSLL